MRLVIERRASRSIAASIALVLVGGQGCAYKYEFHTNLPASERRVTETRHIGIWGHQYSEEPFDLERACPQGVAEFGSYVSFLDWIPGLLTIGLYTPRTAYAVCAADTGER